MKKLLAFVALAFAVITTVSCELPPPDVKPAAAPAQPQATEQVKAGVGVGLKGRSLDQHSGIVVTPAKTLFAAKEKIVFEIQVPSTLQNYKALNIDGKGPATHEEFMEKIIKEGQIQLPVLPEGHKYVYDPMTEQLMVERPASAEPAPMP